MRIGSRILALATALLLFTSVDSTQAQEIPQPLFGNCCGCKAQLRFRPGQSLDFLKIGGRVLPTATAIIDPVLSGMTLDLSNANGGLLSASVPPGAFIEKQGGQKFIYKNQAAKKNGGIQSAIIQERNDAHGGWLISIRAYDDLSGATLEEMSTTIVIGTSSFIDTSDWGPRRNGWRKKFQQ